MSVWHAGSARLQVYAAQSHAWQSQRGSAAEGGRLYLVPTRPGQSSLRLRFSIDDAAREEQVLQLRAAPTWSWQAQLQAQENLPARELLTALLPKVAGTERAFVLYELARREFRTAQRALGAQHLQEAAESARRLGGISLARSCYGLLCAERR